MNSSPWLPQPADGDMEAALGRLVECWLGNWTLAHPGTVTRVMRANGGVSPFSFGGSGVAVRAEATDLVALGLASCAGQADVANLNDRQFLADVGEEMLSDLPAHLGSERALVQAEAGRGDGFEQGAAGEAAYHFRVTSRAGDWSVLIDMDEAAAVRARRTAAGSVRHLPLMPLAAALADEEVRLGCHLGTAQLTAADITALAAGDVIVLDRSLMASVPLTVEGNMARRGTAQIGAVNDAIQVRIAEALEFARTN